MGSPRGPGAPGADQVVYISLISEGPRFDLECRHGRASAAPCPGEVTGQPELSFSSLWVLAPSPSPLPPSPPPSLLAHRGPGRLGGPGRRLPERNASGERGAGGCAPAPA